MDSLPDPVEEKGYGEDLDILQLLYGCAAPSDLNGSPLFPSLFVLSLAPRNAKLGEPVGFLLSLQTPATDPSFSPSIHNPSTLKLQVPGFGGTHISGGKDLVSLSFHGRYKVLAGSGGVGELRLQISLTQSQSNNRCSNVFGARRHTGHHGSGASFLLKRFSFDGKAF